MADWELVRHRVEGKPLCVLFIHGFGGDAAKTWGRFPGLLSDDGRIAGWDIVSYGYQSDFLRPNAVGLWSADPDIPTIADQLRAMVEIGFANYEGIALVAHSMGGLVAQRALVDDDSFRKRVLFTFLFGTPSAGLLKTWPFKLPILRLLNRQASNMSRGSDFIVDLRRRWDKQFRYETPFDFMAAAGAEDEFVPRESSIDPFSEKHRAVVPGDHLTIVKPEIAEDPSVQLVARGIAGDAAPAGPWNAARVAMERLEFAAVIERLAPYQDELDDSALVDLALALDASNRPEEAIAVLVNRGQLGTDAMGVLAGRLKRRWILDRHKTDARRALELYGAAYREASNGDDHAQAYYHGVNVAFLTLAFAGDLAGARTVARGVLAHCESAAGRDELGSDRTWRLATEGEANLLLGERARGLEAYRHAVVGPPQPKPRRLDSMYRQALYLADLLEDTEAAEGIVGIFRGTEQ
jgi:pimeloyl-ACP methyl ester carboxylesterase